MLSMYYLWSLTVSLTLLTLTLTLTLLTLTLTLSLFVDVALRAASILKNHDLLYLFNLLQVAKLRNLLGFEHREYASLISFEKCCRMH